MSTISPAQSSIAATARLSSKDLGDRYRQIEAAVFAGKDHVTIGEGQDETPVHILATGGKHPAFRPKGADDVRYSTIVTEEGGYPGKSYLVTYQLGSADGIDNMLRVTSVEENPDWGNEGQVPANSQTIFGAFW
jgi:hypothetical protein